MRPRAIRIGLEAAGRKNPEIFSPTIGRQLFERGLIDEICRQEGSFKDPAPSGAKSLNQLGDDLGRTAA